MAGFTLVPNHLIEAWKSEPLMLAFLLHLFGGANWKELSWRGIIIKPGQIVFGRGEWSKRTGIPEQSLRTCIKRLKEIGELTTCQPEANQIRGKRSTSKYSVLTIVKWEEYRSRKNEPTRSEESDQPEANQKLTTAKEEKENNNTLLSKSAGACEIETEPEKNETEKITEFVCAITEKLGPVNAGALVPGWIRAGVDLHLDVIQTIDRILAADSSKQFANLKYFEKPILESCALRRVTPILPIINQSQGESRENFGGNNYTIDNSNGTIIHPRADGLARCGTKVKSASDKWDDAWAATIE